MNNLKKLHAKKEKEEKRKITQEEAAKGIGTSRESYSYFLNGKRPMTTEFVVKAAKYYNTTTDNIFGIANKGNNETLRVNKIEYTDLTTHFTQEELEKMANDEMMQKHYEVKDDSMSPKFEIGDDVFIDVQTNIENNKIMLLKLNNNELLRKVIKSGDNTLLTALNPSYEPIIVSNDDLLEVLGVVTKVIKHIA